MTALLFMVGFAVSLLLFLLGVFILEQDCGRELDALHKRIEALERSRDPVRPARKPAARTRTHADGGNE
jgi:hypothetical protein